MTFLNNMSAVLLSLVILSGSARAGQGDITSPEPSIHPELAAHTDHFVPKVYKVGDNIYSAVGYSIGNVIMIVGDDGVIIVDAGTQPVETAAAYKALRKFSDKPVKAVVYTHFHPDHWGGVKAIVSSAQVASGEVKIFAHKSTLDHIIHQGGDLGPILAMRAAYSFGILLSEEDSHRMNDGIGPRTTVGQATFIRPTDLVDEYLETTIAGLRLQFLHVPSEAPDEIAVYLPDQNILMSGEAIQGPTLPNIHTLRGTKFRDPRIWYQSLDKLRALKADHMVPSHGQPIYGAGKVEEVLRMTRDGIQYIHDQTIRLMNKGYNADQLAGAVKFPAELNNYAPYLRQYYGTVKHAVRQIYNGYLGWFSGDPVDLDPIPEKEASRRYIALMGGEEKVMAAAKKALQEGQHQWAAELSSHLIRLAPEDKSVRQIKAVALRHMGYASMNTNWRNWYLTGAMELEGAVRPLKDLQVIGAIFSSPDVVAEWPLSRIISGLSTRLNPDKIADNSITLTFEASDTKEHHSLELRGAVAQFHNSPVKDSDVTLRGPRQILLAVIMGYISLEDGQKSGKLQIMGNSIKAQKAFAAFDPVLSPIKLVVR